MPSSLLTPAPPSSPGLQTWQAVTALTATTLASLNLSLSLLLTPRLLELPTPQMLSTWRASYKQTVAVFPVGMVACGASYAALAGTLHSGAAGGGRVRTRLLASAAALCFSIVPWTRMLMLKRLYARILELADKADATVEGEDGAAAAGVRGEREEGFSVQQDESAKWLVDQWGLYNLGRGVPVLVAGAIGVFTLGW